MNLRKKKELAAKTLGVGKDRIAFVKSSLNEIKEAITKKDMQDLNQDGAIIIKEKKGRKKNLNKKIKKSPGNIRKKVNTRKRDYVIMTRKLRRYILDLKSKEMLSKEEFKDIRKKIRNKNFKSKAHLKQYIKELKKWKHKNKEEKVLKQITRKD